MLLTKEVGQAVEARIFKYLGYNSSMVMKKVIYFLIRFALNGLVMVMPKTAGRLAFKLFCTPVIAAKLRYRDKKIIDKATRETFIVNHKLVVAYLWGSGENPVLYIHGWRSRGARGSNFVESLLQDGYSVVAFDAPAHGESEGKQTTMLEYEECIVALHKKYGDFKAVIAHSFGVIAGFHAIRHGVVTERIVAIAGVCEMDYLLEEYVKQLGFSHQLRQALRSELEAFFTPETNISQSLSVSYQADKILGPILLIHDKEDDVVHFEQADKIAAAYGSQIERMTTQGLGHHRILTDPTVSQRVIRFIVH